MSFEFIVNGIPKAALEAVKDRRTDHAENVRRCAANAAVVAANRSFEDFARARRAEVYATAAVFYLLGMPYSVSTQDRTLWP